MHRLTERSQSVRVMTVRTLHNYLESVSNGTCRFSVYKVQRDRVSIRADYMSSGKKRHSYLILPGYPTGSPEDDPSRNLNVVLDPLEFTDAPGPAERHVFVPLLGHDLLSQYEKLHADSGVPVSRCC